ncbi:MAG: response regulator [Candidatus Aminicenantales bacterium]
MKAILIIEDDDQIRALLRQILEREGYQVFDAPDGKKGISLYRQQLPDLVITDLVMPEKEGIETIIELKRNYPRVKIIAISGGGKVIPEIYLEMAEKLGAACTIKKPFQREDVLDAIHQIL